VQGVRPAFGRPTRVGAASGVPLSLSADDILTIQEALVRAGGDLDATGTWDDDSRAALIAYQSSERLPVTGNIDAETLDALGVELP
jgi:peptidoglycan hydrolase-like protein with peptidoglycan-binding domain